MKHRGVFFVLVATSLIFASLSATASSRLDSLLSLCDGCHGQDGNSKKEEVPSIAGFSVFYLADALRMYKAGERESVSYRIEGQEETDMNQIAGLLSDADRLALAKHYAGMTFIPHQQAFKSEWAKRGEKVHQYYCEKCHAEGGTSPENDAAILAGQWTKYLRRQFKQFASGKRLMPRGMERYFVTLTKQDKEALIHYYASQY